MTEKQSVRQKKNRPDPKDPKVRERYGTMTGVVGIGVNLLLATCKLIAGLFASSVAIVADAVNNFSDAGSSIITLISFRISAKPADRHHPFGHARIEYIASMIVSFLILLVGTQLAIDSGKTLFGLQESALPDPTPLTFAVLGVSILAKLLLALFYRKIGKRIDSQVVAAASTDSLSDCVSTAAVLISAVVVRYFRLPVFDAVVGLIVALMILIAGIRILNKTKNSLLGEAPVGETVSRITDIVSRFPEALGIHDMMVHNYGPNHYIASFHVEVDGNGNFFALHDVIDNIEHTVYRELGIPCTIHMDPIVLNDPRVDELKAFTGKIIEAVDPALRMHDFRAVIGNTHTNLIFDIVLPFESKDTPDAVREKIEKAVSAERPDCFCVITVDRG